jgi:Arc/MetJ-type ribon-helix-helix transcriptional regulator
MRSDLTSFTVSLPRDLKKFLQERAASSGCSTPSEYVRRLLHADQKAHAQELLEKKLLEGLDGPARELTRTDWANLKRDVLRRIRQGARVGRAPL